MGRGARADVMVDECTRAAPLLILVLIFDFDFDFGFDF